jgi:hypothetical protein
MKKLLIGGGAIAMAFLLSSCFVLQAFVIKKGALQPGDTTTIAMTVHPASTTASKEYQFVLVGVDTPADLAVGKATWGTNGNFGGPTPMVVQAGLYTAVGTDCDTDPAFTLSALSGLTWKGFTTQNKVGDKGAVSKTSVIAIVLNAKKAATSSDTVQVVGVTGVWGDATGDGVSSDDSFICSGNGSGAVFIK